MHRLILLSPLALATSPVAGFPIRRTKGDPASYSAPDGYTYVPDLPPPAYDQATHRIERELTENAYGWTIVALTEDEIADRLPSYYETVTGIRLATDEQDQTAFTRMLALIELNQMDPTSTIVIKDVAGEKHEITVEQFKLLMKEYGAYCYSLHVSS